MTKSIRTNHKRATTRSSERGAIAIVICAVVVLLLAGTAVYMRIRSTQSKPVSSSEITCESELAKKIVSKENLEPLQGCSRTTKDYDGKTYVILSFSYGEGMDCPSGCIYDHYSAFVEESGEYFQYASPSLDSTTLRNVFACGITTESAKAMVDNKAKLVKKNGRYSWVTTLDDELTEDAYGNLCRLNGTVTTKFPTSNKEEFRLTSYDLEVTFPHVPGCSSNYSAEGEYDSCFSRYAAIKLDTSYCNQPPIDTGFERSGLESTQETARRARRLCVTAVAERKLNTATCDDLRKFSGNGRSTDRDIEDCVWDVNISRNDMGLDQQL